MAPRYLFHAAERAGLSPNYQCRWLTPDEEELDDRHLLERILDWQPDIVCCTLYLWNIERTLHLLRRVRQALVGMKVIVGGPEVAFQHPFLFKTGLPDAAVVGEGETVFPQILSALAKGHQADSRQVAWKTGRRYSWGKLPSPGVTLQECLPPAHHSSWKPDPNGMAYLETGRGCPLRCSYCRYGHMRRKAISTEPNMLWQFVLQPEQEEPLDLFDDMIAEIRKGPPLWTDRFASVAGWDRIASRRVFVLLKAPGRYSRSWVAAAEALLEDHFY